MRRAKGARTLAKAGSPVCSPTHMNPQKSLRSKFSSPNRNNGNNIEAACEVACSQPTAAAKAREIEDGRPPVVRGSADPLSNRVPQGVKNVHRLLDTAEDDCVALEQRTARR